MLRWLAWLLLGCLLSVHVVKTIKSIDTCQKSCLVGLLMLWVTCHMNFGNPVKSRVLGLFNGLCTSWLLLGCLLSVHVVKTIKSIDTCQKSCLVGLLMLWVTCHMNFGNPVKSRVLGLFNGLCTSWLLLGCLLSVHVVKKIKSIDTCQKSCLVGLLMLWVTCHMNFGNPVKSRVLGLFNGLCTSLT